jgi:catechol 2,3-dioxygenase-like lactoylglutathione lyase family enzyme
VTRPPQPPPAVEAVVETVVYAADLAAAEGFYAGVLGLPVVGREPGRQVFFRVGSATMLLVFDPSATLEGGTFPPHGAGGPGHVALGVRPEALDAWRRHLTAHKIAIEQEYTWPRGGHSLYFRVPAGNLDRNLRLIDNRHCRGLGDGVESCAPLVHRPGSQWAGTRWSGTDKNGKQAVLSAGGYVTVCGRRRAGHGR